MRRVLFFIFTLIISSNCYSQFTPFFFIQVSDPQLGMIEHNKSWEREKMLLKKAVSAINLLNPSFVVFTGDLVNDGESLDQIRDYKNIEASIKKNIPVYHLPGNHDLNQHFNKEGNDFYIKHFDYDRFSFEKNHCLFIGLNTEIMSSDDESLEKEHRDWFSKQLETSKGAAHIVLFGHRPIFMKTVDEKDSYKNVTKRTRKYYLDLIKKYGVKNMFVGHLHYNKEINMNNFKTIATNSVCVPFKEDVGFRVVKVYPDHISSDYYYLNSIPAKISF